MGRGPGRPLSKIYDAHFNVRVKAETLVKLNQLQDRLGINRSELVRTWIEQGIERHERAEHATVTAAAVAEA